MLADLLFGQYRRRVLALLLLHPESSWHVREIARLTHTQPGTVSRELARLTEAGLLRRVAMGNQVYYSANTQCPIFGELAGLLRKTAGIADVLTDALASFVSEIQLALVFGSVARGEEHAGSDVDVLIVGDITFSNAVAALYRAQTTLQREINPAVYSVSAFRKKIQEGQAWAKDILVKPKLYLIGDADDLGQLAGD